MVEFYNARILVLLPGNIAASYQIHWNLQTYKYSHQRIASECFVLEVKAIRHLLGYTKHQTHNLGKK